MCKLFQATCIVDFFAPSRHLLQIFHGRARPNETHKVLHQTCQHKEVPTPYQLMSHQRHSEGFPWSLQKNECVPVSARVSLLSVSSKQKLDFRAAWSTCKPTSSLSELTSWLHTRRQSQCKKRCEKQNIGAKKANKSLELQL